MSFDKVAIHVESLSKRYEIYDRPGDRLKQFLIPLASKIIGKKAKNYFHEFWALKNISFEVRRGQTVGIIGKNGSGKSTLLQIICGTITPTTGAVRISGRVAALLELGSGFNPDFSGRENVYLNAAVLGLTKEETDLRFEDIVSFADIGAFLDQPVKTYSSGMMVRLAFAVIAHVDADILVIDEALSVGDAYFTQKCMRFLREFMKNGTVLFVSHDSASIKSLCDMAIWLDRGSVVEKGEAKYVCENYLEAFYESQQGASLIQGSNSQPLLPEHSYLPGDIRDDIINRSTLRNDIQIFSFNDDRLSFGVGGAKITKVLLSDGDGNALSWVIGGESASLIIDAEVMCPLSSPIIGFAFKDRLGQELFGDNTYISYIDSPVPCKSGEIIRAIFSFQMPRLAAGDYSIGVAIADGTQQEHVQHHWIHDALLIKSHFTSVSTGIIGLPMKQITLRLAEKD